MLTINNRKVNLPVNSTIINGTIVSNPMFSTPGYGLVQNKTATSVTNTIEEPVRSSNGGTEIIEEILTGTINDAKLANGNDNISVPRPSGNVTATVGDALEQQ